MPKILAGATREASWGRGQCTVGLCRSYRTHRLATNLPQEEEHQGDGLWAQQDREGQRQKGWLLTHSHPETVVWTGGEIRVKNLGGTSSAWDIRVYLSGMPLVNGRLATENTLPKETRCCLEWSPWLIGPSGHLFAVNSVTR